MVSEGKLDQFGETAQMLPILQAVRLGEVMVAKGQLNSHGNEDWDNPNAPFPHHNYCECHICKTADMLTMRCFLGVGVDDAGEMD